MAPKTAVLINHYAMFLAKGTHSSRFRAYLLSVLPPED